MFLNPEWFPNSTLWVTSFDIIAIGSQYCRPYFPTGVFWKALGSLRVILVPFWYSLVTLLYVFGTLSAPAGHPCATLLQLLGKLAELSWVPWHFTTNDSSAWLICCGMSELLLDFQEVNM